MKRAAQKENKNDRSVFEKVNTGIERQKFIKIKTKTTFIWKEQYLFN